MGISIVLLLLLLLVVGYSIYQRRHTYQMIDRLLDNVLSCEAITDSDVQEGEFSALVSKITQIQDVLGNHVEHAEQEKEQVKSLVSNMSHQLKTPLTNLSIYTDILSEGKLSGERREEFTNKMQRQIDKMNWVVES